MEIWKDVKGFEGFYQVSNLGCVKSLPREVPWRSGVARRKGKILGQHPDSFGYMRVKMCRESVNKTFKGHRLVASAFLFDTYFEGATVNHKNFNQKDNRVENLEWCSMVDNIKHAHFHERFNRRGIRNGNNKLSELQIAEIRTKYVKGQKAPSAGSTEFLAETYGVSRTQILRIVTNKCWSSV